MNINDPKNASPEDVKRIITGSGADHAAARMVQGQGAQRNPYEEKQKLMAQDMGRMLQQSKATAVRLNAVMDYFGYLGMFLTQELDEQGYPVGPASTPPNCPFKIFEGLIDAGVISEMPAYGFDAFFVEHNKLSDVLIMLNTAFVKGQATMTEVLESAREFNSDPQRITKIRGDQIGLRGYIEHNPDKLSDEELLALGVEFEIELVKVEEDEDEGSAPSPEDEESSEESVSLRADA